MTRQPFDLLEFPLDGLRLIEASAGTGKTFSLAGLYLRLLVEKRLDVREILVMTFTRAATQELRERIRRRLADAARLAFMPDAADPANNEHQVALAIIERATANEPRARIAQRLRDAASRMDDATISTIHAFAQRAAQENAFESGQPFDRGTQVDDRAVRREAITDYWRSQTIGHTAAQASTFLSLWPDPDALASDLLPLLEKPHLAVWGPSDEQIAAVTRAAREAWDAGAAELLDLLDRAATTDALLKTKPLRKAIDDAGGAAALIARIATGLAGTASGHAAIPPWFADLATDAGVREHFKKAALPTARDPAAGYRPQDLDVVQRLAELAPVARIAACRAALAAVRDSIRTRKRASRHFSFADMIEALHEAITDGARGKALATALQRNWPYALVDEFQDTDPLQYEILRRTYRGRESGALIMIGDPKQAIYGFRGGDVFAYLAAARDADGCYELDTNFRSTRGVLDGIEALFLGPAERTQQGAFLLPQIRFHPVACGRQAGDVVLRRHDQPLPSITVWPLDGDEYSAANGRRAMLDATVAEICTLLHPDTGARRVAGDGSDRAVAPADIAVLVNTNAEAAAVQRALARHGIAAVCLQRASVFASEEARHMLLLLRAVESSARPEAIRAALATPLMGLRMRDLLALADDETAWHAAVARFQGAHEDWRSRGLLAMLEPLLQAAAPRVLALEDGERRMTNYLQLAELLARAEAETFGFASLIRWLAQQIEEPEDDNEADARQLRLESDDALVRIVTVHRVKGLQYPIVFLPFAPTLGPKPPRSPWVYHDASGRGWVDFVEQPSERHAAAALEARAESLRLLYVALTRAEQACYLGWGAIRTAQNSALAWLLNADDIEDPRILQTAQNKLPDWLDGARARQRLDEWAARANGAVRVTPPPAPLAAGYRVPYGPAPTGTARTDLPARRPDWSVFSFSRLVAGGPQQVPGSGFDDEPRLPRPDELPGAADRRTAIALRGPAFGSAIHQLLERVDPADWPAPGTELDERHAAQIARHLLNAGLPIGEGAARADLLNGVASMISRTLHTPLPHIGRLAQIPAAQRLVEMEFFLGLGGERIGRLIDHMNAHGYGVGLPRERRQLALHGLMQGFVDLIVEAGGRYWILDYKTNDLGPRVEDYQDVALRRAVEHGHYDLQYLIYLIALHRHLDRTLPGYDPGTHLGGAQYLFLRGMNGRDAQTGVFVDRPDPDFLIALDRLFARAGGTT